MDGQNFDTRSLTNSILLSSSTRTSVCSTHSTMDSTILSNNCPSPALSLIVRQALISPTNSSSTTNESKVRLQNSVKQPSKVTFSQQLITDGKCSMNSREHSNDSSSTNEICLNKKTKPTPPPRLQSTSSSAVSSATSCSSSSSSSSSSSTSSSSSNGNANLRTTNGLCGIIPLAMSSDCRHNGRCNSLSSSSTDTDSVISNPRGITSHKSPTVINTKPILVSNGFHNNKTSSTTTNSTTLMRASVTDL